MIRPIYDVSNINIWKVKMSTYLKTPGMHVYLASTKKTYFGNDKYIEANAQVLIELRQSLSKEYLLIVSHYDSTFAVWSTLTSPEQQMANVLEKKSSGDQSDQACFMV